MDIVSLHACPRQVVSASRHVPALTQGDAHAAERLFERYGDGAYRMALRITGVSQDAEAAVREALAAAARRMETVPDDSTFASWIHRIATSVAYRRLRGRRSSVNEIVLDDVLPSFDADGQHFGPMVDWSDRVADGESPGELHRVLTNAIDALPADYRTALVLHDVEGMSSSDIAETLGVGASGVRPRVHRARLLVRQRLSEYFKSA